MAINEELKVMVKAETAAAVRELNKLKGTTQGNTQAFSSMAKTLVGFGGVTAALLVTKRLVIDNIKAGIQYAAALEQQAVAFETLLGSAEEARDLLEDIQKFAASTPFQLPDLQRGTQRLLAFGTAAEDAVKTLGMLGDLSMGNAATLDRLTLAYGKLQAKGKATLEELNMFTEAGVPLMKALADQLEVTSEELFTMITKGEVGFEDVTKAMKAMTSEGGQFFQMTQRQSETLAGRMSTLKDNVDALRGALMEGLVDPLKEAVEWATNLVQTMSEAARQNQLAKAFGANLALAQSPEFATMTGTDQVKLLTDVLTGYQRKLDTGTFVTDIALKRRHGGDIEALAAALIDAERKVVSDARGAGFAQPAKGAPSGFGGSMPSGIAVPSGMNAVLWAMENEWFFQPAPKNGFAGNKALTDLKTLPVSNFDMIMATLTGAVPNLSQHGVPQFTQGPLGAAGARGTAGLGTQAQMGSLSPFLASGMPFLGGERVTQFGGSPIDLSIIASQQSKAMDKIAKENIGKFTKAPEEIKETATAIDQLGKSLEQAFSQQMIDSLFEFGRAMGEGADMTEAMASGVLSFAEMLAQNLPTILLSAAGTAASAGRWEIAAALLAAAGAAAVVGGAFVGGVEQVRNGDGRASGAVVVNNTRVEGNVFVEDELDRRAVSAVGRAGRGY